MAKSRRESLARFVKRTIDEKGLTLREIERRAAEASRKTGKKLKISDGYISEIINEGTVNLTVEKIVALAFGLDVDARKIFDLACAEYISPKQLESEPQGFDTSDLLYALELVKKIVVNGKLMEFLEEALQLPSDKQEHVLEALKKLVDKESKREPNGKAE